MFFSHDTELTLRARIALINTDRVDGEQPGSQRELDGYLEGWGWTGRRDHDDAELEAVHELRRRRLGRIWASADDEVRTVGGQRAAVGHPRGAMADRHPEMPGGICTWPRSTTRWPSGWGPRWRCRWPTWSASANCAG